MLSRVFLFSFLMSWAFFSAHGFFAMPPSQLLLAMRFAENDGVGAGYCGRGVYSVLNRLGYGGLDSVNGQDWECVLQRAGWKPLYCPSPEKAPFGSVLVYWSDMRRWGANRVGTKGGLFGHVELVIRDGEGHRKYVSDSVRASSGGTVPVNFTRRAWIPPSSGPIEGYFWGFAWFDSARMAEEVSALMADRLAFSTRLFNDRKANMRPEGRIFVLR